MESGRATCGLVAITEASHAEGRQSDLGQAYPLTASNTQNSIGPAAKQGAVLCFAENIFIHFQSIAKFAHVLRKGHMV
jgi:hypothetical protein